MRFLSRMIYLGAFFFLASCKIHREQGSILLGSTCAPPCWYQITPGVSTIEDVKHTLGSILVIDPESILWSNRLSILTPQVTANLPDGSLVFLFFINEKVACINFQGSIGYSFGEAVELLGEPEFITVVRMLGPGRAWFAPSSDSHTVIKAIITSKGIAYGYDAYEIPKHLQNTIHPDIALDNILFFDPLLFDQLAEEGFFLTSEANLQDTQAAMVPWSGYKEIGTDYPYAQPLEKK